MILKIVEPIRSATTFNLILDTLKKRDMRNYIYIMLGTYSGLRISDILKLKVKDVKGRYTINLKEKKTNKQNIIEMNEDLRLALKEYCKDRLPDEYLLQSSIGVNKPITRVRAWQIMKEIGEEFQIENLGCHTLRKTFGYHYYKQTGDIATLMLIFNHSRETVTLAYIGVTQDTVNNARRNFKIRS